MFIVPLRGYILPAAAAVILVALSFNKAQAQEQSGWQQRWQSFKEDVIEPTKKAVTPLVDKAKVALQHMSRDVPAPRPGQEVEDPNALKTVCDLPQWRTLRVFGNALIGDAEKRYVTTYLTAHKACVDGADHAVIAAELDKLFWQASEYTAISNRAEDAQQAARILLEQFSEAEPEEAPAVQTAQPGLLKEGSLLLNFRADGIFTAAIPELNKKAVCVPADDTTVCTIIMGDGTEPRTITYHSGIAHHAIGNLIANAGLN